LIGDGWKKGPKSAKSCGVPNGCSEARTEDSSVGSGYFESWVSESCKGKDGERGIDDIDVYRALRRGFVMENSIRAGKNAGEQVCKVVEQNKGARDLGVVTIVVGHSKLLVKTVEWEDLK
jgi:hypothetical protein